MANVLKRWQYNIPLRKADVPVVIVLALIVSSIMASVDTLLFPIYVNPLFSCNNTTNTTAYCQSINETTTLFGVFAIPNNQLYWQVTQFLSVSFAVLLGAFRGFIGKQILPGVLYGLTIMAPNLVGFGDLEFYWLQGKPLPTGWPWLDTMAGGLDKYLSNAADVTTQGIYLSLLATAVGLAIVWKLAFKFQKKR